MKVFDEMDFNDIRRTAWSGAVDTAERIEREGKGDVNKASILDEIREYGEVRVSKLSYRNIGPRNWNTYIELLIDGVPMEEEEKYAPFVKALEEWKDEECSRLYTALEEEYDHLTSDEYIIEQLMNEDADYEFYADGTEY